MYILAIIGIIEIYNANKLSNKNDRNDLLLISVCWSILFLSIYLGYGRRSSPIEYFNEFWGIRFAPLPFSPTGLNWYWNALLELGYLGFHPARPVRNPFDSIQFQSPNIIITMIILVGAFCQFKTDRRWALINIGIILISILTSFFKLYPFGSRLGLFLIPVAFSYICSAIDSNFMSPSIIQRIVGYQIVILILVIIGYPSIKGFIFPYDNANIKGALSYLEENSVSTDTLMMIDDTNPAYIYYHNDYKLPSFRTIQVFKKPFSEDNFLHQVCSNNSGNRIWILITQMFNEGREFIHKMERKGNLLDSWESPGSGLYYFNFDMNSICTQ